VPDEPSEPVPDDGSSGDGGDGGDETTAPEPGRESVDVAVLDTGMVTAHPDFQGTNAAGAPRIKDSIDAVQGACDYYGLATCESVEVITDENGHGSAVGSIIGGETLGYSDHAALWNVDVSSAEDGSASGLTMRYGLGEAARADIPIANVSYDIDVIGSSLVDSTGALVSANERAVADSGMVIVQAAGNDAGNYTQLENTEANWSADNPLYDQVIVAGALDANNNLAGYSRLAGSDETVQARFIVAPGTNPGLYITDPDGTATPFTGTSSSAPVVSAALAEILSIWDFLAPSEAAALLLENADQSFSDLYGDTTCGASGDSDCGRYTFGMGRVDIDASLAPEGEPKVLTGDGVDYDNGQRVANTRVQLSGPLAAAQPALAAALDEVSVFDALGRDYTADLSGQVTRDRTQTAVDAHLQQTLAAQATPSPITLIDTEAGQLKASQRQAPNGLLDHLHLAYQGKGLSLAVTHSATGDTTARHNPLARDLIGYRAIHQLAPESLSSNTMARIRTPINASLSLQAGLTDGRWATVDNAKSAIQTGHLGIDYAFADGWSARLGMASMVERNGLLGLSGGGGLSSDAPGETVMPHIGLRYAHSDWSVFAEYARGRGAADYANSLIESIDVTVEKAALGAQLTTQGGDGRLTLVASSPLHVSSGEAMLRLPDGRTRTGAIEQTRERVDLTAHQRPIALNLGYHFSASPRARFGVSLRHAEDQDTRTEAVIAGHWHF
jgi:hypothetical protein